MSTASAGLGVGHAYFLQTILGSSSHKKVRTVSAKIKDCNGLGLGQAYFLQMILGSSSHKKVRTVSAKIEDSDGLGLGQAYCLQMILGSSSHKKLGPSQLKSKILMGWDWVKRTFYK